MEKITPSELKLDIVNCKICGEVCNDSKGICKKCFATYYPKIKAFMNANPGLTYLALVGHKDIPVPRRVFYEFEQAGFIKVRP